MRKEKLIELKKYINEIKWTKDEIVDCEKHFVTVESHKFCINNREIIREKIYKNGNDGSAVIIVPIEKYSKEFIMVIEPRVFTKMKIAVSFPAGYIEKNESPTKAALRELKEETGYEPNKIKHLDSFYQDEGISAAYNHIVLAIDCEKKYNQSLDSDEMIKYMTFTYAELLELENYGYISGCNSKLALCRLKNK